MSASHSSKTKRESVPLSLPSWQEELARAITQPEELLELLRLDRDYLEGARRAAAAFPLRVTRHFVGLMRPGDPADPLLRQVLPLTEELKETRGFVADPVGDRGAELGSGILRKYHGRALLVTTGACAIHCRYCFRRHYPYGAHTLTPGNAAQALENIGAMVDVDEVILSGGDPLMLSDRRLSALLKGIEGLRRIRRLRLHTRLPVVLPNRLTPTLGRLLGASHLSVALVIHANHPKELHPAFGEALAHLRTVGVSVLNQSVLLRGVNDEAETLASLSEQLFDYGVLPYYLHQLDRVAGAGHFAVSDQRAIALITELRRRLPGYLVPRLVVERPGAPAKLPLESLPRRP